MKRLLFGGIAFLCFACANDNGTIDCATSTDLSDNLNFTSKSAESIANEQLLLNFVDEEGQNIYETGTDNPEKTTILYNGQTYSDVVDQYNEETKYLIWINGFSEGKNVYTISIDPVDSKIYSLTVYTTLTDFSVCTGPAFAIDSVLYDTEKQVLEKTSDRLKKLTIVK
ncbi:hypothetical protein [Pareuzebyella sediminis]|uniref:hypothetical protein n=1 Tax=Pareuzebyella sediminis TaxID=2607998 RepID=UPI0011EF472B|nr:hypothetical protein [Pareuzebyella sediminis]